MIQPTRKQREIEERDLKILEVARGILIRTGYLGLRMDQIAAEMEYSKGTIYQHYPNKEEIILALANQALSKRSDLFELAVTLRRRSRERLVAVAAAAEVFVERFPHFFQVEQIIRLNSVWEKTSEKRRSVMRSCETRCMSMISGVVRDAVACGDLTLPEGCCPEDMVFGLWSMNSGAFTIVSSSESLQDLGIADAMNALRRNQNLMVDGYGWRPLSTETDFDEVLLAVKSQLYSSDIVQAP